MLVETDNYKFELDDSWINESVFNSSVISTQHYKADKNKANDKEVLFISISDIYPKIRGNGVPIFNDGEVEGVLKTAKERTVSILKAIMSNSALPPVEVVDLNEGGYKYKLVHGSHRLHCSIAAGFTQIPAIYGFDINSC